ncbi:CoA-binding protein [Oxyplasma meridianum]|uniref:CoA-binding protein n=1 Tax=Oxyplasma meridianum TaxID=3073602 RepID=A0AAX4NGA2_9ARCH
MAYDEDKIPEILNNARNIAVVGISDKTDRDSYGVATYLKEHGYNIIPINPGLKEWKGIRSYPDLQAVPENVEIDIVDIFRKSDAVVPIVNDALKRKPSAIWMQEGVVNNEAAKMARDAGILVVMDHCIMKEHLKQKK